jgi:hypothetical protein
LVRPNISRFARKRYDVTEESKPSAPTSPEQAFEQAREFGDQMAGQAREFGERAGEQMGGFGEQAGQMAEQAVEQARALSEQILETARKAGQDALQRYIEWLQAVAEQQRNFASSPQVSEMDWFASMFRAQADFTQQFAKMVGTSSGQHPPS